MEKYFSSLDEFAKWAASNQIGVISIDAHKCLSVNGAIRYGLSCIAKSANSQKLLCGQFNTNKYSDPQLIDAEAKKIETKLRSCGFSVDRMRFPAAGATV